jgi:hypothetical protein
LVLRLPRERPKSRQLKQGCYRDPLMARTGSTSNGSHRKRITVRHDPRKTNNYLCR